MKRYRYPILHEDWHSYYWKNTFTYGSWPLGNNKVVPKEKARLTFTIEDSVKDIEQSPPDNSPTSTSFKVSSPLGPYEGACFNIRDHVYEEPVQAQRREPWEPYQRLKGKS